MSRGILLLKLMSGKINMDAINNQVANDCSPEEHFMPDYLKYQKYISNEIISAKDRIRDLIGGIHYGEDGRYKEILLRNIITSKLPNFAATGTGFVLGENEISTQIDIIIFRKDFPLIFQCSDFVIVPKEAVLGIVEVKTRLCTRDFHEVYLKAHKNGQIIGAQVFNGIFAYESDMHFSKLPETISETCRSYYENVNHIAFGASYFMKYWPDGQPNGSPHDKYHIYKISDLAFGYFISNLVENVHTQITGDDRIPESMNRIMYPIENTKEAHRKHVIQLPNKRLHKTFGL